MPGANKRDRAAIKRDRAAIKRDRAPIQRDRAPIKRAGVKVKWQTGLSRDLGEGPTYKSPLGTTSPAMMADHLDLPLSCGFRCNLTCHDS